MIISHRHRFVFVKTRKTAGTSIERFLGQFLGPDDVIMGAGERNHEGRWNPTSELVHHPDPSNLKLTLKQWRDRHRYYQHMPAWRLRDRMGRSVWDSYFTFCFERDPWDKLVSFYWWRTRDLATRPDFDTWVRTTPNLSAWPLYTIADRVAVDFIGRFESLETDLARILARIGLDAPVDLPHDKSGYRVDDEAVTFRPELDDWVRQEFRHEIALMGYDRPSPDPSRPGKLRA